MRLPNNFVMGKKDVKIAVFTLLVILIAAGIYHYFYLGSELRGIVYGYVRIIPEDGDNVLTLDKDIELNLPVLASEKTGGAPSIHIINPQEYPVIYGNWTVAFKTFGESYLAIEGVKNTTYASFDDNSTGELEVVELRCGENLVFKDKTTYGGVGVKYYPEKITFSPYSCDNISYFTVRLLHCNDHKQKFSFGNSFDFANNACSGTDAANLRIMDPDGTDNVQGTPLALTISPTTAGLTDSCPSNPSTSVNIYCQKNGTYQARVTCDSCPNLPAEHYATGPYSVLTCAEPSANKFKIYYSTEYKAAFDANGYLFHKGSVTTGAGVGYADPGTGFKVKNSAGNLVASIDSTGNLKIAGTLTQNQSTVTPPTNSFIIKDAAGANVAYIDSSGNMVLKKFDYENWLDTI